MSGTVGCDLTLQRGSSEVLATWDVIRCLRGDLHILFGVVAALLLGCASSVGNTPSLSLRVRPGVTLIVPLFGTEGSAEIGTNDEGRRIGKAAERVVRTTPVLGMLAGDDEDDKTPGTRSSRGLTSEDRFTVALEDADIARLRQSLIERLRKSEAFVKVTDWRPAQVPANALMMELTLGRRGMKIDTKRFTCFIESHVAILDKEGVRQEANVSAVGTSLVMPDSAKTDAAEKLIQSALDILNRTP
jgi:hypothetical protein